MQAEPQRPKAGDAALDVITLEIIQSALIAACEEMSQAMMRTAYSPIFAEGRDIQDDGEWRALAARLELDDADALIAQPEVKDALRANTDEAIRRGVYGVPTFAVGGELFWGSDTTDMLLDYLSDPTMFTRGEMARIADMPPGVERRQ